VVAVTAVAASVAWAGPSEAAFRGANGRIAFDYDQHVSVDGEPPTSSTSREIWTANPDGSDLRRLTDNLAADTDPTWSPDGRYLAFVSDRTGVPQVFVMRADGSGQRQVTRSPSGATQPAWSPYGLFLVYAQAGDLWTSTASGFFARRLTRTPDVTESAPAWSPRGLRIAYTAEPATAGPEDRLHSIWTIRIDGRQARDLSAVTPAPGLEDANPDWSPDGTQIVFDTRRGEGPFVNGTGIWVMRADGTAPHVLREGEQNVGLGTPVFSPDGRQVVEVLGGFGQVFLEVDELGASGDPAAFTTSFGGTAGDDETVLENPSWQPVRG
jgi:Tol biopolymer transport system component